MTGHQLGILFSAIAFTVGAFIPAFVNDRPTRGFYWRGISWISLGLAFYVWAHYIGAPK